MRPTSSRTILLSALIAGGLFGFGLALSTMVKPESILQFLLLNNMGLLLVLGGAAGVTSIAYALLPRLMKRPVFGPVFHTHPSRLNAPTLVGAAIFGIGWGLSGGLPRSRNRRSWRRQLAAGPERAGHPPRSRSTRALLRQT